MGIRCSFDPFGVLPYVTQPSSNGYKVYWTIDNISFNTTTNTYVLPSMWIINEQEVSGNDVSIENATLENNNTYTIELSYTVAEGSFTGTPSVAISDTNYTTVPHTN